MTYTEKLRDPRWQKKRLEILNRDDWRCQSCGHDDKTLHVHHRNYYKGLEPWEVSEDTLITLCEDCHEYETVYMAERIDDLSMMVKEKFLSGEVGRLADAFHNLIPHHCSEVFSSVIQHWFSRPELTKEMYDRYFEYLHNNSKNDSFLS